MEMMSDFRIIMSSIFPASATTTRYLPDQDEILDLNEHLAVTTTDGSLAECAVMISADFQMIVKGIE